MATYRTGNRVRVDTGIDLGFGFKPSLALSAKAFDKLDIDIRSFRVPLKRAIQQVIAPSIGKNFLTGGRPTWEPLADATLRIKAQSRNLRYPVEAPLLRSGLLMRTMQQYNIWTVTTTQAAILDLPDKIWYGKIHQAGYGSASAAAAGATSAEGLKGIVEATLAGAYRAYVPARPFAMIQPEDVDKIQLVFDTWMRERIAAAFGRRLW